MTKRAQTDLKYVCVVVIQLQLAEPRISISPFFCLETWRPAPHGLMLTSFFPHSLFFQDEFAA